MKRLLLIIGFFVLSLSFLSVRALAQTSTSSAFNGEVPMESLVATDAASASEAARLASESAAVAVKIQEKKDSDLTETGGKQKDKLAAFLDENPPEPLAWNNFIQHGIRYAVNEGVPVNTLVLVLLFPMVASLIAASRHMIGLRGFGVYSPAVLSVALVSTGITEGILIFLAIVGTAVLAKRIIWRLKLSYLPRTAMLLWMISLGILGVLFIAPSINVVTLMTVNIFPILILVLLAENFLDAQSRTKQAEAIALTVETIGLAALSALLLKWELVQKVALLEPELLILSTALLNIVIGKFTGLRISERFRFRSIIEE
jgi:hypothetical protein